jgi:DNA-binding transcriptional LysR family regulator
MDLVRIHGVWSYFPSFLAVAEAQHLRRAARDLRVSPSALSRSISMLEHRIGYPLFDRCGGRMRLNAMGDRLLLSVRQVMRLVDGVLADQATADVVYMLSRGPSKVELCIVHAEAAAAVSQSQH